METTSKLINIYLDISGDYFLSYYDILELLEMDEAFEVDTCCLEFFSSDLLSKGCEVIVHKYYDNTKIVMSELFDSTTSSKYTDRAIHKDHNLKNLLLAGEFNFA